MSAPRGTTPTLKLTFTDQGIDLTAADKVYVTFDFGGEQLTKESEDLTIGARTIGVHLTQAKTKERRPEHARTLLRHLQ